MANKLIFPDSYVRKAKKFLRKHPEVHDQYRKILELLELNPHHPSLRLHGVQGRLSGLSSVSVNMSYRIVLDMAIRDNDIILIYLGSHEQVY